MTRIVIIGGGFGGLYATKYLLKYFKKDKITLINKNNFFLFTPLLHEVATGGQNRHNIAFEIRKLSMQRNFEFICSEVTKIDVKKKMIYYNKRSIVYDKLVIAIGSKAHFFAIKGGEKFALPLKTMPDAIRIRNKILSSFEKANYSDDTSLLHFTIIGGGPTGIELAGELAGYTAQLTKRYSNINKKDISITILQGAENILPVQAADKFRKLAVRELTKKGIKIVTGARVSEVKEDEVIFSKDNKREVLPSKNTFLAAGVTTNTIPMIPKITNKQNSFEVNHFFQVDGYFDVFAIGDCALNFNPHATRPNPRLAQLATRQAKHLAKNLHLSNMSRPMIPFVFKQQGFLVSIGEWDAIADLHHVVFKGVFGWWVWRTIYLSKIVGLQNKIATAFEWFLLLFGKRDGSQL